MAEGTAVAVIVSQSWEPSAPLQVADTRPDHDVAAELRRAAPDGGRAKSGPNPVRWPQDGSNG